MKKFSRSDVRLIRLGLVLVVWPILIYGLLELLNSSGAEGELYETLGLLTLYVGPASVGVGLVVFALFLISEIFLLPWRTNHCRGTGCRKSQND